MKLVVYCTQVGFPVLMVVALAQLYGLSITSVGRRRLVDLLTRAATRG